MRSRNKNRRHILLGLIAQGLLQYLALSKPVEVWPHFRIWLRTMKTDATPSEPVVASALRHSLRDFLPNLPFTHFLRKFLADKLATKIQAIFTELADAA